MLKILITVLTYVIQPTRCSYLLHIFCAGMLLLTKQCCRLSQYAHEILKNDIASAKEHVQPATSLIAK